eukprot:TRINITY_DN4887_c0_g2_i1.p1 TRINITY_DN4887_c0_g2~~TRINITY_DN4887_c0_g2_i1.p1  ORF type:complete len:1566 (-),score=382.43 TRINITY_DN4887_c0_g2_i1:596-5293(-)
MKVFCKLLVSNPLLWMCVFAIIPLALTLIAVSNGNIDIDMNDTSFAKADNEATNNQEALEAAIQEKKELDSAILSGAVSIERRRQLRTSNSIRSLSDTIMQERSQPLHHFDMIYVPKSGDNVFTEDSMREIRDIENLIRDHKSFKRICYTKNRYQCEIPDTIINYLFPSKVGGESSVSSKLRLDGKGTEMQPLLSTLKLMSQNSLYFYMDKEFTSENLVSHSTRSTFLLGLPLAGYANPYLSNGQQVDELVNVVTEEIFPFLESLNTKHVKILYFGSEPIINELIMNVLIRDLILALVSFCFVAFYMWFHTGSLFLATIGMFEICLSLPVAYFFYIFVFGIKTMLILNFVALFVIMGIGADDVFIFTDHMKQSLARFSTIRERVEWTFSKAGKATFVTSITTAISFYANITSAIRPVQQFGLFMGTTVLANYVLVVTLYGSALVCHAKYFENSGIWQSLFLRLQICLRIGKGKNCEEFQERDNNAENIETPPGTLSASSISSNGSSATNDSRQAKAPSEATVTTVSSASTNTSSTSSASVRQRLYAHAQSERELRRLKKISRRRSGVVDIEKMDYKLDSKDGWPMMERFFHNRYSCWLQKWKKVILLVVPLIMILTGYMIVMNLEPADGQLQLFKKEHNLGALMTVLDEDYNESWFGDFGQVADMMTSASENEVTLCDDYHTDPPNCETRTCYKQCSGHGTCDILTYTCDCISGFDGEGCEINSDNNSAGVGSTSSDGSNAGNTEAEDRKNKISEFVDAENLPPPEDQANLIRVGSQLITIEPSSLLKTSDKVYISIGNGGMEPLTLNLHADVTPLKSWVTVSPDVLVLLGWELNSFEVKIDLSPLLPGETYFQSLQFGTADKVHVLDYQIKVIMPHGSISRALSTHPASNHFTNMANHHQKRWLRESGHFVEVNEPSSSDLFTDTTCHTQLFESDDLTDDPHFERETMFESFSQLSNDESIATVRRLVGENSGYCYDPFCSGNGECKNGVCQCNGGWDGDSCETKIWTSCETSCSGHGVCLLEQGVCICDTSWNGSRDCSIPSCPSNCSGHGTCEDGHCQCDPMSNWKGDACGLYVDPNRCPLDCNDHGKCIEGICECDTLYSGDDCTVFDRTNMLPENRMADISVYWGIDGLDSSRATESYPNGKVDLDKSFNFYDRDTQQHLSDACAFILDTMDVVSHRCIVNDIAANAEKFGIPFPVENKRLLEGLLELALQQGAFNKVTDLGLNIETMNINWMRFTFKVNLDNQISADDGYPVLQQWDRLVDELNNDSPKDSGYAVHSSSLWVRIMLEKEAIAGSITAWGISNMCAFISIALFTRNIVIAIYAMATIICIIACLLGFMVWIMGWKFGVIEALSLTIFVGASVDYCLHLSHNYNESKCNTRFQRMRAALRTTGSSIFSAALTTIGASIILLACTIVIFVQFGYIIAANTILSLFFGLVVLPSMLLYIGPIKRVNKSIENNENKNKTNNNNNSSGNKVEENIKSPERSELPPPNLPRRFFSHNDAIDMTTAMSSENFHTTVGTLGLTNGTKMLINTPIDNSENTLDVVETTSMMDTLDISEV